MTKRILLLAAALYALYASIASSTPIPSPSPTAKQKCCFCLYPNPGEDDSDTFQAMCNSCLPRQFPECDIYASFAAQDFKEGIKSYSCRNPISVLNLQHGPDPSYTTDIIEVCQSAYPGCSINLNDLSCSTYENESAALAYIEIIKTSLPDGAIVDICGSGSVNKYTGCTFHRVIKRYVVAPAFTKAKLGLCPAFGSACDFSRDSKKPFACVDTLGRPMTITCCPTRESNFGYWGHAHGCAGTGCSSRTCPTIQSCKDGTWRVQGCSREGSTGTCLKYSFKCSDLNKVCGTGKSGPECVPPPSPSPSQ